MIVLRKRPKTEILKGAYPRLSHKLRMNIQRTRVST